MSTNFKWQQTERTSSEKKELEAVIRAVGRRENLNYFSALYDRKKDFYKIDSMTFASSMRYNSYLTRYKSFDAS